ncbi:MAG: metallophosphoesterase family protein [Promethearchaeota archaeon]
MKYKGLSLIIILTLSVPVVKTVISNTVPPVEFDTLEDSLLFAAIGDPHYGWTNKQFASEIVDAWMNDRNLPRLDFCINVGDLTHFGTPKGYRRAMMGSFGNLLLPYMFVFGNHDNADYKTGTEREIYPGSVGMPSTDLYIKPHDAIEAGFNATGICSMNYAFMFDNILFIVFGEQGECMLLTSEQKEWLEYLTLRYHDVTTITVSHQGFYAEATSKDPYRYYNDRDWWKNFIERNPQIVMHVHGHNHNLNHYTYYGLDVVDTGITNDVGKPWTVIFQVSRSSVKVGVYDVMQRKWVNNHLFSKGVATTYNKSGLQWYSFQEQVQDGEGIQFPNRFISKEYKLDVIGVGPELVNENRDFRFWVQTNWNLLQIPIDDVFWIGYDDDSDNPVNGDAVVFEGMDNFSTSVRPALRFQPFTGMYTKWVEGKVPDSTTPKVVPNNTYIIRSRFKSDAYIEHGLNVLVSIYSKNLSTPIYGPVLIGDGLPLYTDWTWYNRTLKVPDLADAWIMQVTWETLGNSKSYLDEWSVTLENATSSTSNITVQFNNMSFSTDADLQQYQHVTFDLPSTLIDNYNYLKFKIDDSRIAMIALTYIEPYIWSDDLTFGINSVLGNDAFDVHLDQLTYCGPTNGYSISTFNHHEMIANIPGLNTITLHSGYKCYRIDNFTEAQDFNVEFKKY